jgi:lipoyl-dependent peroxiredoxin
MSTRVSTVSWNGSLVGGSGSISLPSTSTTFDYSLATRAADRATTTSPEELLAAAYASCYAMQLAALLDPGDGESPELHVEVAVTQGGPDIDFGIADIALTVKCAGLNRTEREFADLAFTASAVCPVGRALSGTPVSVDAVLLP